MKKELGAGITIAVLLVSFLLIGATTASVLIGNTQSNGSISSEDIEKMVNEVVDDISTYIKITDIYGKYSSTENGPRIQQIAIPIKLYVSSTLDLMQFTIELNNGNQLSILTYTGNADCMQSHTLFDDPLWNSINEGTFGVLVTIDDDQSIVNFHTINKNTDAAFLLIKLPQDFTMKQGDTLQITLVPSVGTSRTIEAIAPLPTTSVVILGPE